MESTATIRELCSITLPVIRCRFDYADRDGQISKRDVRLCRFFVTDEGRQYLEGVCVLRGSRRTFRLDRLQSALTHVASGTEYPSARVAEQLAELIQLAQKPEHETSNRGAAMGLPLVWMLLGGLLAWGLLSA
ncbi:WYL domain-containing protein [Ferrimonas balearica]|uniref:WYL domain-containing protein n=1 Tax=Ferrimonas balearica TaxID=44012 RepID=UPI001C57D5BB|nr:WYL domain-containing protein [Ferrimonas balearica]MBW3163335.1 WYL domain-containing protein [Ferrimonas balearica]